MCTYMCMFMHTHTKTHTHIHTNTYVKQTFKVLNLRNAYLLMFTFSLILLKLALYDRKGLSFLRSINNA